MEKADNNPYPKVGIGVMIFKDGRVLLGKRKGSHGAGEYAFPGGHLEYMESFADCAKRETKEETGIGITNIKFLLLANVNFFSPKHYIHLTLTADWENGEPHTLEPHKSEGWGWYGLNALPKPLFHTVTLSLEAHKTGKNYFDF